MKKVSLIIIIFCNFADCMELYSVNTLFNRKIIKIFI